MKKLLILVVALALVGGVAMAQVTVGGIVEFGIQNSFDSDDHELPGDIGTEESFGDTRLIVSGSVDDYTSVYFRLPVNVEFEYLEVDRAHATTDIGALLGTDDAGVGLSLNYGYNEFASADVANITGYEFERLRYDTAGAGVFRSRVFKSGGVAVSSNVMDMVNVYAAFGLSVDDQNTENDQQNMILGLDGGIDVGVGTAVFQLVYTQTAEGAVEDWKTFGIAAGLTGFEATPDLELALTGSYVMFLDAEGAQPEWKYGLGLTADYAGLASSSVSFLGWDGTEANALGITVGVTPLDFVSVDLGIALALDDDAGYGVNPADNETFNSMDISVGLMAGAMEFRLGYFLLNDDQNPIPNADLNAVTDDHSGLYMNWKVEF